MPYALCQARMAGGGIMFLGGPFVRSVVHYQTCKHDILKMNELMLVQIGTSGLRGNGMK